MAGGAARCVPLAARRFGPSPPLWTVLDAIAAGEVRPHYQPVVDLRFGSLLGVEALARWCLGDDTVLPATAFVPLLETARRVTDLTAFMLDRACADLGAWQRRFHLPAGFHVAVNVSATELVDDRLVGLVRECLELYAIDPASLCLEVTETAEIADVAAAAAVLAELAHGVGVRLAVDDFGTGFATAQYLAAFPFDTLKIDQCFVAGLGAGDESAAFVRHTIGYATHRDLRVVAEGIETHHQAKALVAAGCAVGQGFGIGVPSPAAEVLAGWVHPQLTPV